MMILATRVLIAAATAAAVFVSWFIAQPDPSEAPPLRVALANLSQADSLHVRLTRDGQTIDVWARRPGQLRWELGAGKYRIDDGERRWEVDERANRAVPAESALPHGEAAGIDLLSLLELPGLVDREQLLAQRPVERQVFDGAMCDVYRWRSEQSDSPWQLEARVASESSLLQSLHSFEMREGRWQPVCRLVVAAVNPPVDEQLFQIADTLTVDGRIGKLLDLQGLVAVRPPGHSRWTPAAPGLILKPGDLLRCDLRGANAATLQLVPHTRLTLGPGTLVELIKPREIRLTSGEAKIICDPDEAVTLTGSDGQTLEVIGTQYVRATEKGLVKLGQEPAWVPGFEGTTTKEAVGSLVAKIDGRDVPLTVGFHKVAVDIRDQIARTVIEESFVNHTMNQLEGVFYFPLPQDASISGFGMWIGDELVEADIVEKQRARDIYETILREKRDPGLLEWTGGNIFKARVFPIPARGEKRIKISYTQVLPLRGRSFCYTYGLQSELLRQHPLRELAIDVHIRSERALSQVTSRTHGVRVSSTQHAARVEFSAQEYTPQRDFEVVVDLAQEDASAVLIPHRRGDDGYFMLQLTPPGTHLTDERDVLPDGDPLEILVVADTSASMREDAREMQRALASALLSSLSEQDSFNLMMYDVQCHWLFDEPVPAAARNVEAALASLENRVSLGWTDLDKALESVIARMGNRTHVVYLGDGVATAGDADPIALNQRLRRLFEGRQGTLHAVALSSSYEPLVLKTLASLGSGSYRHVTDPQGVRKVVRELLTEMTRPVTRITSIEIQGLRTARVYPQELPNLPNGTQQILLGRYLPEAADVEGEIVVQATRGGEPLQMVTPFHLQSLDEGNAFIPRLWARMHLDALLEQGDSQAIRDEVIALSEQYHIITPYTSLLVLENDEDRQRFQIPRRFQMRDGERFFAEGRDSVNYELLQQQMRQAGDWRIRLRMQMLRELATLGREPGGLQMERYAWNRRAGMAGPPWGGAHSHWYFRDGISSLGFSPDDSMLSMEGGMDISSGSMPMSGPRSLATSGALNYDFFAPEDRAAKSLGLDWDGDFKMIFEGTLGEKKEYAEVASLGRDKDALFSLGDLRQDGLALPELGRTTSGRRQNMNGVWAGEYFETGTLDTATMGLDNSMRLWDAELGGVLRSRGRGALGGGGLGDVAGGAFQRTSRPSQPPAGQWLDMLFPQLPAVPSEPAKDDANSTWPEEARQLAAQLLRTELRQIHQPLEISRVARYYDVRWEQLTSERKFTAVLNPDSWLIVEESDGAQTIVRACDAQQQSVYSRALLLGRRRPAEPLDLRYPPIELDGYVWSGLESMYPNYAVQLTPQEGGKVLLTLQHPTNETYQLEFLIDTHRHVLLQVQNRQQGRVTSTQKLSEFVQVAGVWFATQIESFDDRQRRSSLITQSFQELDEGAAAERRSALQEGRDLVQWLQLPLPQVRDAMKAVRDGKGKFEDHLVVLLTYEQVQRWQRVLQQLEAMEQLAPDKPGMAWVRDALLKLARNRELLRQRMLERAVALASEDVSSNSNTYFLANHLLNQASGILEAHEMLSLLDALKPIYARQPVQLNAMKHWMRQLVGQLQGAGRGVEALALQKQLASEYPHDMDLQQHYAQALVRAREYEAAIAWVDNVLTPQSPWYPHEEESLRNVITQLYRSSGRYPELVEYLRSWIATEPESTSPYQQYLTALIKNDQIDAADERIAHWLHEALQDSSLTRPALARAQAAVQQALGQGYDLHTDRLDQRWYEPLAEIVRAYLRNLEAPSSDLDSLAETIMQQHRFQRTEQWEQLHEEAAQVLEKQLESLKFDQLNRLVNWLWNTPAVNVEQWKRIADEIANHWQAETLDAQKHAWGQLLARVLSGKVGTEAHLAFLRRQIGEGPPQWHDQYVEQLFQSLIAQPWSQAYENEAKQLVAGISTMEDPVQRLQIQVSALHHLTDTMVQARYTRLMAEVEDPTELTRTELQEAQNTRQQQARRQYAESLEAWKQHAPATLLPWIDVEWIWLQVQLGEQLGEVIERCWEFLGAEPMQLSPQQRAEDALRLPLVHRYILTLVNLAARKTAPEGLEDRLREYIEQGAERGDDLTSFWRYVEFQLLVVLDQPERLTDLLRGWMGQEDTFAVAYRVALGYLLAEHGQVEQAVEHFEQLRADSLLAAPELQSLADWYLVLDQRTKHEAALRARLEMTDESQLYRWLNAQLNLLQQEGGRNGMLGGNRFGGTRENVSAVPGEMDDNLPRAFLVLFAKSSNPQQYLGLLRQFYQHNHEFELLTGVAESVVGHTAGQVYPFLTGMNSLLAEVREEATCDALTAHLEIVRERAESAVDRRALDLLELMIERRAAEVLDQPGPHAEAALAALRRALKEEWTEGEPRLMADFLASLGQIAVRGLAEQQVRALEDLYRQSLPDAAARLYIAGCLARTYWSYNRPDDALELLEAELDVCRHAHDGLLSASANGQLQTYISYLSSRGLFTRGEGVLLQQLALPHNSQQHLWLQRQLYDLYDHALGNGGAVSLGEGVMLYQVLTGRLQEELDHPDQEYRRDLLRRLISVYRTAHDSHVVSVPVDITAFARDRLPEILRHQVNDYQSIVGEVAEAIKHLAGTREALAMLVRSIANEPQWFQFVREDGWNQHGWRLAQWREEVKDLGDLAEPLLDLVVAELRRGLETREFRNRAIYWRHHAHFWEEQVPAFLRTAETVYAQHNISSDAVRHIAEYLSQGLEKYPRAIEMLDQAHRDGILGEAGIWQLAEYLHHEQQHAESIPLLEPLVDKHPDQLHYRTKLMHACFRTQRREQLLDLLAATDEYFHQKNRWTESVMAQLGASCLENQLFEQAVEYYQEAISVHKRTQPHRGIGQETLSSYCQQLARAYSGVSKTGEAVDAACEAIVSWGPRREQRKSALYALEHVLREAPDLERYVEQLDQESQTQGSDKPIVRKALGIVYFQKEQYVQAIEQLRQAVALQPHDAETHEKLIECFDKLGDSEGAIRQSLQLLQLKPRDIETYRQLGRRYEKAGSPEPVERTYTSIVEALPNEAEGHAMLAQIREEQERWEDAALHWELVAQLRSLEPTGLLKLATVQIRLQQWTEAKETLARLRKQSWPPRFADVDAQTRALARQMEERQP
jgi:tetratricopeptide (TPR) repeat protein